MLAHVRSARRLLPWLPLLLVYGCGSSSAPDRAPTSPGLDAGAEGGGLLPEAAPPPDSAVPPAPDGATTPPPDGATTPASACGEPTFIDAPLKWVELRVSANNGMGGVLDAMRAAADQHATSPVRIILGKGTYARRPDQDGQGELYFQRLQRTIDTPVHIVAEDSSPNATTLTQGFNLLGVSYIGIEGVTIGPATVGAFDGASHAAPKPLQAGAGIHVSGAATHATENGAPGGVVDFAIYGTYEPSHHIVIRNVTIQNVFGDDNESGIAAVGFDNDGMKFNQVSDLIVVGSTVRQTSRHGIDNVGVHRALFCDNVIGENGGGLGIEAKGGSVDIQFDNNVLYRVRRFELGGSNSDATYYWSADGKYNYEASRVVARNNIIIDAREAAIQFEGCLDCAAINNTVFFTADYRPPTQGPDADGGDAIRIADSIVNGSAPCTGPSGGDTGNAGSDCQYWNGQDYVTADPCWGVGSNPPAPVCRPLLSDRLRVYNNLFYSALPLWSGSFVGSGAGTSTIPCPLNRFGAATMASNANYWFNGGVAPSLDACSAYVDGPKSEGLSGAGAEPGITSPRIDSSSYSSLRSSARQALLPLPTSRLRGAGESSLDGAPTRDARGNSRSTTPTIGALE